MASYATTQDLESYWRTLGADEAGRAETLLGFASVSVRAHVGGEPSDAEAAKFVVVDMVKSAMASGVGAPMTSFQQSGGPYSASVQFANPSGDLYWKRQYDDVLCVSGMSHLTVRAVSAHDDGQ